MRFFTDLSLLRRPIAVGGSLALVALLACSSSKSGAGGAAADGGPEESGSDSGFPQCSSTEACVGYPAFADWVCLQTCGLDASDCPSGMTCTGVSGCCEGTGCSATLRHVCVPETDAGDAASDAPSDVLTADDEFNFPVCGASEACVRDSPLSVWTCHPKCGLDASDCPSGTSCARLTGCCTAADCSAVSHDVCVPDADAGEGG